MERRVRRVVGKVACLHSLRAWLDQVAVTTVPFSALPSALHCPPPLSSASHGTALPCPALPFPSLPCSAVVRRR